MGDETVFRAIAGAPYGDWECSEAPTNSSLSINRGGYDAAAFGAGVACKRPSKCSGSLSRRYGMASKQSDTPPLLAPGCEELKCDVVGISKRQCRVVRRVHDATVGDAEFVETDFPCL